MNNGRQEVKSLLSSFACSLFSWFLFRFQHICKKKQCIIPIHHLKTDNPPPPPHIIIFLPMLHPPTNHPKCVESHLKGTSCFHSCGNESAKNLHYPILIIDTLEFFQQHLVHHPNISWCREHSTLTLSLPVLS